MVSCTPFFVTAFIVIALCATQIKSDPDLACDDENSPCETNELCCLFKKFFTIGRSSWGKGCCGLPQGVCCLNGPACCPHDHICHDDGRCISKSVYTRLVRKSVQSSPCTKII